MAFARLLRHQQQSKLCRIALSRLNSKTFKSQAFPATTNIHHLSTSTSNKVTNNTAAPVDELDLTFNNAKEAYRSKTTWEILRAYVIFQLCSVETLVDHNQKLMTLGQKILGKTIFGKIMEASFYGHFVAGADEKAIKPKIDRLRQFGVKAILDYSVEEDISQDEARKIEMESCTPISSDSSYGHENFTKKYHVYADFADRRRQSLSKTYFYLDEAHCERNMGTFLQAIEAVADATDGTGFAAIKITALGRPQLLLHLSEAIARVHRYVGSVTGRKGQVLQQAIKPEELKSRLEKAAKDDPTVKAWLDGLTFDSSGLIHVLPWQGLLEAQKGLGDTLKVADFATGKMLNLMPLLSNMEEKMFRNMMERLHTIFQFAKRLDVRVMVDAEQTYFQPAISRITMEMMKKYNGDKAIVYNTYQCYLKKALDYFSANMEQAKRQNFYFGAKLVRGAYMEQERERAAQIGYPDPINATFNDTTDMYHKCMEEGMRRTAQFKDAGQPQSISLMAATHNEDTVRFVVQKMDEYGIKVADRAICFGQLYGMCDQISFPLGNNIKRKNITSDVLKINYVTYKLKGRINQ